MRSNRELLDYYVERYNAGDLDTVMTLYGDDAVQRMADGVFKGRREIRERLARDLATCPDATYTVDSFFEDGDSFADEWTFTGTQDGPFALPDGAVLPPTGRPLEVHGMELVVVDKLYWDNLAIAAQLRLIPQTV
jgi:predicted ester cyclase